MTTAAGKAIGLSCRESRLYHDVAAIDVPELGKRLAKSRDGPSLVERRGEKPDTRDLRRLLGFPSWSEQQQRHDSGEGPVSHETHVLISGRTSRQRLFPLEPRSRA